MLSTEIKDLASALCKAQAVMKSAKKKTANPFFRKPYADIESIWDACQDALTKNGLSITQSVELSPTGAIILRTFLLHTSGQYIGSDYPIIPVKDRDPQALGSAITYARRYSLSAICGVVTTEDDDDAEAAMGREVTTHGAVNTPAKPAPKASAPVAAAPKNPAYGPGGVHTAPPHSPAVVAPAPVARPRQAAPVVPQPRAPMSDAELDFFGGGPS